MFNFINHRTIIALCLSAIAVTATAADHYSRKTVSAVMLSDTGGVSTTLVSVTVPAGTWQVHSKASAVNFSSADYVRCETYAGTVKVSGASTMTGNSGGMPAVATIANVGTITTTSSRLFKLSCYHDNNVPGQYVDPDATLLITRAPGTAASN